MTAPARNSPSTARKGKGQGERKQPVESTRTRAKSRGRSRSTAAERAYARRNERVGTERRARQPQRAATRSSRSQPRQEDAQRQQPVARKARQLPSKVTSSRLPFVVAVMVVLTAGIVSTLWLSSAAVSNSYELRRAQTEVTALNEQKETLLRQVSIMNSAPALQHRAKELGLVRPPDPAHLVMHPDGSVTVVGEPEAAKAPPPAPPAPDVGPQRQDAPAPPARER